MLHGPPLPSYEPAKAGKVRLADSSGLTNKSSISDVAILFGRIRKPWRSIPSVAKRPSSSGNEELSTRKAVASDGSSHVYSRNSQDPEVAGTVVSNPCFHPLRQKLSPRIEPSLMRSPTKGSISPVSGSSTRTPFNRGHAGNSLSGSTYGAAQDSPTHIPLRNTRIDALMQGDRTSSQEQMSLSELLAREEYESRHLQKLSFGTDTVRPTSIPSRPKSTKSTSNSSTRYRAKLRSVPGRHQILQPDAVALALARGDHVKKFTWDKYLDQYSKGAFNMCIPPNPEIAEDDITYLPAVFPHDEAARLSVAQQCDALWYEFGAPYAQELVDQATRFFDVSFAAISFFDEKREIFKAQQGMDSDGVFGRPYSMTAHALYTMDVFVVTDTKQDWRFRKNPWVDEWPGVRFIAVAPIIADNQVIGTFAIMDKHPRPIFSYEDRRYLVDFADAAIREVKEKYELQKQTAFYRQTPILERDSIVYGTQDDHAYSSNTKARVPLTITKTMTIQQTMTERPVSQDELTPPSSADESRPFNQSTSASHIASQYSFPLPPRTLAGSLNMASRPYSVSDLSSVHDNPAPTPHLQDRLVPPCPVTELTPERFFGLSDRELYEPSIMSSLDTRTSPQKTKKSIRQSRSEGRISAFDCNYEDWSSYVRSQQQEETMSQVDASDVEGEEFTGPLDVVLADSFFQKSPEKISGKHSQKVSNSPKDARRGVYPGPPPTSALPPIPPSTRPSPTRGNTPQHSPPLPRQCATQDEVQLAASQRELSAQSSPRVVCARNGLRYSTTDHHANLTSVCANIANSLNYDLVYIVELKSLSTTDGSEKAQMQTKILSHYPLVNPDTIAVSLAQHLEALRKTISIFTSNVSAQQLANTHPALRGYQFGVLLSLNTPEPYDYRVTGTILGAFKSTTSSLLVAEEQKSGNDVADVENLKKFIQDFRLEQLLHQIDERSAVSHNTLGALNEDDFRDRRDKAVGLGIDTSNASSGKQASRGRTILPSEEIAYSDDDDEIF